MMFDWLYLWNLIWSFFLILSLVFVPAFMVFIYFITRESKAQRILGQTRRPARGPSEKNSAASPSGIGAPSIPPLARPTVPPLTSPVVPPLNRHEVRDQGRRAA
ncbi:hypothetical protein I2485_00910 [Nesterenkonia sp. E16_7]|uniref:hypothetical protein n=1 Tax=unclassified Nesterenkonia TaxID=2629769 RepID=UPI001A92FB98|nr:MULTISPECIES: hypothetical protein [unclassified Nesterenkonia]MBO0596537.1 hypothetical protein [Nesterenkonia sp. E16_10]MBO0597208.1 hypothetical protein [Nesterenkonia sp. E16_7]